MGISALPYYGGKSPRRSKSVWINKILGSDTNCLYVEPFAGMLGILLSRPVSDMEMVNDTNLDLVSWWLMVRDCPEEFGRRIYYTPRSRSIYNDSIDLLKNGNGTTMDKAVAFHVVIAQSMISAPNSVDSQWSVLYNTHRSSLGLRNRSDALMDGRMQALTNRLRDVQIENKDALDILERTSGVGNALVYCDPPYLYADTKPYGDNKVDYEALGEVLLAQSGRIAISGYGDEWDHLGWNRHELACVATAGKRSSTTKRTEVLWANFEQSNPTLFG